MPKLKIGDILIIGIREYEVVKNEGVYHLKRTDGSILKANVNYMDEGLASGKYKIKSQAWNKLIKRMACFT